MAAEVDLNPVVLVRVSSKRHREVKLIECPFCRKKHTHGIPPGVEGPDIGHRVAHCATADLPLALRHVSRGYHLRLESRSILI